MKTKTGRFRVAHTTDKKRMRDKRRSVRTEMRRRMHLPIREQGAWLRSVYTGHLNYYGMPGNSEAISTFRFWLVRDWWRVLTRRSQRSRLSWDADEPDRRRSGYPPPRITHPWPLGTLRRQNPRQEPSAVTPHAGICAGGRRKRRSLPRSFVIDVSRSRKIVGWQLAGHMRTHLVLDALRMALSRRRAGADVELVFHSDAGSQYTSSRFAQVLDDHGVLASIGSVGDALDNALAESFIDSFKTELIADRVWRTRTQLELAVVEYVGWFNHDRLHEALGDIPPAEFEHVHAAQTAISGQRSVAVLSPRAADRLYAPRLVRERASHPETALSGPHGPQAGFADIPPLIQGNEPTPVSAGSQPGSVCAAWRR